MSRRTQRKNQRRALQRARRVHPQSTVKLQTEDTIVGWFARGRNEPGGLCDGDALMVTSSRRAIRHLGQRFPYTDWDYQPTSFREIMWGMNNGEAYAFDERAYNAFLPLSRRAGLPFGKEDFSDPGPTGIHLVRIQLTFDLIDATRQR